jgi:hypothetical protein
MYYGRKGSTEYSKGNKTVPGKVATTHTEDGHKTGYPNKRYNTKPKGRRHIGRPRKRWRDQFHFEDTRNRNET